MKHIYFLRASRSEALKKYLVPNWVENRYIAFSSLVKHSLCVMAEHNPQAELSDDHQACLGSRIN
jgi:hypothetical protein